MAICLMCWHASAVGVCEIGAKYDHCTRNWVLPSTSATWVGTGGIGMIHCHRRKVGVWGIDGKKEVNYAITV